MPQRPNGVRISSHLRLKGSSCQPDDKRPPAPLARQSKFDREPDADRDHQPILASISALRSRSISSMKPTEGTSSTSAVIAAIW